VRKLLDPKLGQDIQTRDVGNLGCLALGAKDRILGRLQGIRLGRQGGDRARLGGEADWRIGLGLGQMSDVDMPGSDCCVVAAVNPEALWVWRGRLALRDHSCLCVNLLGTIRDVPGAALIDGCVDLQVKDGLSLGVVVRVGSPASVLLPLGDLAKAHCSMAKATDGRRGD